MLKSKEFYNNLRKGVGKNLAKYGPSCQIRYQVIQKLIKLHKCKSPLLDVGCGIGELTAKLKKQLKTSVFGADFSSEAVRVAKKNHPDINFFQMDLLKGNKIYKKKFNTIIASEVLEHIENVDLAVKQLYRLLNKNGIVILTVPYQKKYWTVHDTFTGHVQRFEKNQLQNILVKNKFKIKNQFSWGRFIYNLYYRILAKTNPNKIMDFNKTNILNKIIKVIVSYILFILFKIEYYIKDSSCKTGRRLFIVAKK